MNSIIESAFNQIKQRARKYVNRKDKKNKKEYYVYRLVEKDFDFIKKIITEVYAKALEQSIYMRK